MSANIRGSDPPEADQALHERCHIIHQRTNRVILLSFSWGFPPLEAEGVVMEAAFHLLSPSERPECDLSLDHGGHQESSKFRAILFPRERNHPPRARSLVGFLAGSSPMELVMWCTCLGGSGRPVLEGDCRMKK